MVLRAYTLLSLVALISVYVYGYQFDDPVYNDLLIEELDNAYRQLTKRSLHLRDRREVSDEEDHKCPHHPWGYKSRKLCCGEEMIKQLLEERSEIHRQCIKEVMEKEGGEPPKDPFSCQNAEKRRKHAVCSVQCVGQKRNFLDEDGNPIADEIKRYAGETVFADAAWFKDSQEDIIIKCLAEAEEAKAKQEFTEASCNPAGITLRHCLFREFQMSCPESEIKNQEACDRFKEHIKHKEMGYGLSSDFDE